MPLHVIQRDNNRQVRFFAEEVRGQRVASKKRGRRKGVDELECEQIGLGFD